MANASIASDSADPSRWNVQRRLRAAWRKEAAYFSLRGGAWLLATLGALAAADFLLDWSLDLPPVLRLLLLLINLACLAAVAWTWLVGPLRRFDEVQTALRVEKACACRDGLLVSCVQFRDDAAAGAGNSRELMRAVRRQAAHAAEAMDFGRIVSPTVLRPALPVAGVAAAVLLAGTLWRPAHAAALVSRLIVPWSNAEYPTRTKIEVLSNNFTVRLGEPVTLDARATGEVPDQGRLFVRVRGGTWEALALKQREAGVFIHTLPRATDDFDYYFALGDARSRPCRVTVARPPHIAETLVHLDYPSYTKIPQETVGVLNLKVPEGTTIQWRLRFDRPVTGAELVAEDHSPVPMHLDAAGTAATLDLAPDASVSYTLNLHWLLGRRALVEPGAKHYLQVIPDADPRVGITFPVEDEKATLSKVVALSYWARDDYALGSATIVYALNDGAEQRVPMGPCDGKAAVEKTFPWKLAGTIPGLRESDLVTFAVEVGNIRAGASHTTRSYSRRIQIVSPNEYLAYTVARQRKLLGQLRPLYLQELEAATNLKPDAAPATQPAKASGTDKTP